MAGEAKYADTVYQPKGGGYGFVWSEEHARMHTLVEVRYRLVAYEAHHELPINPDSPFTKGDKLAESGWEQTPAEARKSIEGEIGVQLDDNAVIWRKTIPVSIPIRTRF